MHSDDINFTTVTTNIWPGEAHISSSDQIQELNLFVTLYSIDALSCALCVLPKHTPLVSLANAQSLS